MKDREHLPLWVVIGELASTGEEGIISVAVDGTPFPLICHTERVVDVIRLLATASRSHINMRLLKYTDAEVIERIKGEADEET